MRFSLQRHNVLLSSAIERHRGCVFKTVGDAFCVTFDDAADALDLPRRVVQPLRARAVQHLEVRERVLADDDEIRDLAGLDAADAGLDLDVPGHEASVQRREVGERRLDGDRGRVHQGQLLAVLVPGLGLVGMEDDLPGRRTGRGRQAGR